MALGCPVVGMIRGGKHMIIDLYLYRAILAVKAGKLPSLTETFRHVEADYGQDETGTVESVIGPISFEHPGFITVSAGNTCNAHGNTLMFFPHHALYLAHHRWE